MSSAGRRPEPITDAHDVSRFDCGNEMLNSWLRSRALDNERRRATRTFVATRDFQVIGYYSLAVSALHRQAATGRIRRNLPQPIPSMLLARLAVDTSAQSEGIGRHLLRDAMLRTLQLLRSRASGSCWCTPSTSGRRRGTGSSTSRRRLPIPFS